jgi:hypothetical protein
MRSIFGECAASRAADQFSAAAQEWMDSFVCLEFYRVTEPELGWWHNDPSKPPHKEGAARWWVPSDFIPGWGQQGRVA